VNLPPPLEYAPPLGRYFFYVWDTMDVPPVQEFADRVVFTPTFDKLQIWGREVGSTYPEDRESTARAEAMGRIMGEWFSVACPDGELGSWALADCVEISEQEFSAAFERHWEPLRLPES